MSDIRPCRVPTCKKLIRFVYDIETGNSIAIDPVPSERGTIAVIPPHQCQQFSIEDAQRLIEAGKPLHERHIKTCADPSWFKASREARKQSNPVTKRQARGASRHKKTA